MLGQNEMHKHTGELDIAQKKQVYNISHDHKFVNFYFGYNHLWG